MFILVTVIIAAIMGFQFGKATKGGNSMVTVSSDGPVKTKKVVCSKCAYELEYTGEDVESSTGHYMGESGTHWYIVCPRESCQKKVHVKAWR